MVGWAALGLAYISWYVTPDRPRQDPRAWALLGVIVLSHLAAIPGALWFGTGNWILTASAFYWLLPALVVFLIADARVFRWLIWIAVIHAVSIFFDNLWLAGLPGNPSGLTFNPNVAAGLLIVSIGLVFGMRRHWWAILPLISAVTFTGSRAAFMGLIVIVGLSLAANKLTWRRFIAVVVLIVSVLAGHSFLHEQFQAANYTAWVHSITVENVTNDIGVRWEVPAWPDLFPHGVVEHLGLHNVPLRMAREAGIVAAAGWLILSAWALTRCRNTPAWWLMVTILLLSIVDHYTWRVHLGSLWFLAAGLLLSRPPNIRPKP
jgi:type IV secretory pathway VirB2 component (pilin)